MIVFGGPSIPPAFSNWRPAGRDEESPGRNDVRVAGYQHTRGLNCPSIGSFTLRRSRTRRTDRSRYEPQIRTSKRPHSHPNSDSPSCADSRVATTPALSSPQVRSPFAKPRAGLRGIVCLFASPVGDDFDTESDQPSLRRNSTMMVTAWMYPIQGFYFFFRNAHRLWHRVARFVLEVAAAIAGLLFLLFTVTFSTQRDFVVWFLPHWTGTPLAVALILLETAVAVVLLFQYRLENAQRKLFVDVLVIRKVTVEPATPDDHAWLQERLIPQLGGVPRDAPMKKVGRQRRPTAYLSQVLTEDSHPILHFLFTLPLNFVPVVGNALFCFLNSFPTAIGLHHYYYTEMKGLSSEEFSAVVHAKKPQYQSFGFVASAFSLIPGLDIILVLTNAVGAALWAADMEKTQGSVKSKWSLKWYDEHGTSYGTFGASTSGASSSLS